MVKSGHCLQQMQRKEGQQNSQAAGMETEKDPLGAISMAGGSVGGPGARCRQLTQGMG